MVAFGSALVMAWTDGTTGSLRFTGSDAYRPRERCTRSPIVDCQMIFTAPSIRTIAVEFGFPRRAGLPTLRVAGLFPYPPCPADMRIPSPRTVRETFGSARTRGFFVCLGEGWSNRSRGPGWGFRAWRLLSSLILRRAACGLDFLRVACRITRMAKSANCTPPLTVWARAELTGFVSVLAVRSGSRPRAD